MPSKRTMLPALFMILPVFLNFSSSADENLRSFFLPSPYGVYSESVHAHLSDSSDSIAAVIQCLTEIIVGEQGKGNDFFLGGFRVFWAHRAAVLSVPPQRRAQANHP